MNHLVSIVRPPTPRLPTAGAVLQQTEVMATYKPRRRQERPGQPVPIEPTSPSVLPGRHQRLERTRYKEWVLSAASTNSNLGTSW
jgi:hypothetical protein